MAQRPFTSTEIQKLFNRMPTTEERRAYSRWRAENPDAFLSEEERLERERLALEEAERWRYLPASYKALDALEREIGEPAAAKVKALIDALIAERHG